MRLTKIAILLSTWLLVLLPSGPATAQQTDNALRGVLEELFGGPREQSSNSTNRGQGADAQILGRQEARRVPFSSDEMQLSFAPLVQQTAPAVVNVYAERTVQAQRSPFAGDPFFEQFFGRQFGQGRPRTQSSLGSGVIIDEEGLVITNNHVIEGMDQIKVALADGREFKSSVVLRDERADLAVLRIADESPFPTIDFAESDQLLTGDLVLAIGNPFGVGQTITSGIVSATARSQVGVSDFGFFIQTDAAINPGNSGGALVDMNGRLVGINTAIFSRSGGSNGIGFAIPSNMVRAVVLQAKGGADAFERPFLGAAFDSVTADMAESLGMRRPSGAIVTSLAADGPAMIAGVQVGDIVLAIDGDRIEHPDALGYRLATKAVGDEVQLDLFSRGKLKDVTVTLVKPPVGLAPESIILAGRGPFAGAEVANITPSLAQKLRLRRNAQGVAITSIERGSNANRSGFRPGDIIEFVNGTEINDIQTMARVAEEGGRSWRFRLNRNGRRIQQFLRF